MRKNVEINHLISGKYINVYMFDIESWIPYFLCVLRNKYNKVMHLLIATEIKVKPLPKRIAGKKYSHVQNSETF